MIFRLFFSYHLYLIFQGQTTNESFKWASVALTHKRLLKAHDKYLKLSRPENIEKIESVDKENDEFNHEIEKIMKTEILSNVQSSSEAKSLNTNSDNNDNHISNIIDSSKIKKNRNMNFEENENENQNDFDEYSNNIRNEENETAVGLTKQRSDSTFDGAPSAVIEDVCNCIIRKEGSSSSGSTSSSRCYDYEYTDNEDIKYSDNNQNFDDNNDNVYLKESEFNIDEHADYLEVCTKVTEKQRRKKDVDMGTGKEKEKEEEREGNDKEEKVELSYYESQHDDTCEKFSEQLIIEEEINDKKSRNVSSTLESVPEKEVVSRNEESVTTGCVPSPFPSKLALPDSEFIFPEYLSKHPGDIPKNSYKQGFYSNLKNVLIPPSELALQLLMENEKR